MKTEGETVEAAEVHPAIEVILEKLDAIVEQGPHAADPRVPAVQLAAALAEYFRTPD